MHAVTTLSIYSNRLKVLPPQLSQLKKLEDLNIGDNNISRIENIPLTIWRLSVYANPLVYIDPDIVSRFKEFKDFRYYLFVDSAQAAILKLEKDKSGRQLRITDLSSKKIFWGDYKNMPPELIKKWGLQESKEQIEPIKDTP